MEPTIVTALIGACSAVVGAVIAYLTARNNSKKDISLTDRQQLSIEQQQFRAEMRSEVTYWREKYDKIEEKLDGLVSTNMKLQAEVDLWKEKYERLERENELLVARVNELEGELMRRR